MSKIYLMVVHYISAGDDVDDLRTNVKNRAFSSPVVRVTAARRLIDEALERFDLETAISSGRFYYVEDLHDALVDLRHAREINDVSYELSCCRDVFGFEIEFQDIAMELEELVGEIVK